MNDFTIKNRNTPDQISRATQLINELCNNIDVDRLQIGSISPNGREIIRNKMTTYDRQYPNATFDNRLLKYENACRGEAAEELVIRTFDLTPNPLSHDKNSPQSYYFDAYKDDLLFEIKSIRFETDKYGAGGSTFEQYHKNIDVLVVTSAARLHINEDPLDDVYVIAIRYMTSSPEISLMWSKCGFKNVDYEFVTRTINTKYQALDKLKEILGG